MRGGGGWAVAGLLPAVLLPGVVGCFTLFAHPTHCMQTPCINIETNAVRAGEMGRTWYEDGKYLKVGAPVQQQGGRGRRGGRLLSRHSGSSASAASDQSLSSTQPPNTPVCACLPVAEEEHFHRFYCLRGAPGGPQVHLTPAPVHPGAVRCGGWQASCCSWGGRPVCNACLFNH